MRQHPMARLRAPVAMRRKGSLRTHRLQSGSGQSRCGRLFRTWPAPSSTELARVLPEILGDDPAMPRPMPINESWERRRFFDALHAAFAHAPHPLLLVIDDLQWCDPDTIDYLLRRCYGQTSRKCPCGGDDSPRRDGPQPSGHAAAGQVGQDRADHRDSAVCRLTEMETGAVARQADCRLRYGTRRI